MRNSKLINNSTLKNDLYIFIYQQRIFIKIPFLPLTVPKSDSSNPIHNYSSLKSLRYLADNRTQLL